MKENLTEMVFILDRSGSMHGLEADTIGGFNSMIEKQKQVEGEAYVSTVLFSNESTVIYDRVDIKKIEPMTDRQYTVGGCTAREAREYAGNSLILSGGIPNELWYPIFPMEKFEEAVKEWLSLKEISPALIAAAGDQVPPGAEERRIFRMGELVAEYGNY